MTLVLPTSKPGQISRGVGFGSEGAINHSDRRKEQKRRGVRMEKQLNGWIDVTCAAAFGSTTNQLRRIQNKPQRTNNQAKRKAKERIFGESSQVLGQNWAEKPHPLKSTLQA